MHTFRSLALIMVVLGASACGNPRSPAAQVQDVAAAERSAGEEVADAKQDQRKDAATDVYNISVARADGEHKVSIQKCDALQGHDQKTCKDQADAAYEAAKATANAIKVAQQP